MPDIAELYGRDPVREWHRLDRDPFHRLEYDTTLRFLVPFLPTEGRVLDAGGGPGRYTIALARRGLAVTLLDLTPELLAIGRHEIERAGLGAMVRIEQGTITDLSHHADGEFDAVLCLGGPLSHVRGAKERAAAMRELARVARPGGVVAVSVMGRLAILIEAAALWPEEPASAERWRALWCLGEDERFVGQYYCHFHLAEELQQLLVDSGLDVLERVGLEGFGSHHQEAVNRMACEQPESFDHWLEAYQALATHPAIVATSGHMLMIARKPVPHG